MKTFISVIPKAPHGPEYIYFVKVDDRVNGIKYYECTIVEQSNVNNTTTVTRYDGTNMTVPSSHIYRLGCKPDDGDDVIVYRGDDPYAVRGDAFYLTRSLLIHPHFIVMMIHIC